MRPRTALIRRGLLLAALAGPLASCAMLTRSEVRGIVAALFPAAEIADMQVDLDLGCGVAVVELAQALDPSAFTPTGRPSTHDGLGERWYEGAGLPGAMDRDPDTSDLLTDAMWSAKPCFPEEEWGFVRDAAVVATWDRTVGTIVVVEASERRRLAVIRLP